MLDQAFIDDCPYEPDALFIDELLHVDPGRSEVVCRMRVCDALPLTCSQRAHPVKHPRHLAGGLLVHVTGMLGFVHAYYVFGLRHAEGWIGYGVRIYDARFSTLAKPEQVLILRARTTQVRKRNYQILARYSFEFSVGNSVVYEADQSAMWVNPVALAAHDPENASEMTVANRDRGLSDPRGSRGRGNRA
jgi:hypothetical protein